MSRIVTCASVFGNKHFHIHFVQVFLGPSARVEGFDEQLWNMNEASEARLRMIEEDNRKLRNEFPLTNLVEDTPVPEPTVPEPKSRGIRALGRKFDSDPPKKVCLQDDQDVEGVRNVVGDTETKP